MLTFEICGRTAGQVIDPQRWRRRELHVIPPPDETALSRRGCLSSSSEKFNKLTLRFLLFFLFTRKTAALGRNYNLTVVMCV